MKTRSQKIQRAFLKANGLSSSSPGLLQLWVHGEISANPHGVASIANLRQTAPEPRWGCCPLHRTTQGCRNPGLEVGTPLGLAKLPCIGVAGVGNFLHSLF